MSNELQEIEQSVESSGVGLFKNNIVTQLLDFLKSLIESVLHYAKCNLNKNLPKYFEKNLDITTKIWKFQTNNQSNEKVKDQKKRELYKEV